MKKYIYLLENDSVIERYDRYDIPWSLESLRIEVNLKLLFGDSFRRTLKYVKNEKPEWLL